MTAIVVGMVLIVVVALVVLSVFSEDDDDWAERRARPGDTDRPGLDDLLD